ncbi:phosphate regulon sensor histidine kinase PhoR [Marinobacter sp. X15-166B]|uniref:phosphate regulon sensor histidine kinase PhoR n=1 Tax=Marinobacter sp. X15-166B TaxID=1897620 RepID=UPI00085C483F|nr:phosphate regulon sensor histidine kinase PhoR [Marinobacter sp. X15-166B]OEY65767.1 phosphate regulon sensor histidine kinase PhoR [Marinobacter sp. X15-166B]
MHYSLLRYLRRILVFLLITTGLGVLVDQPLAGLTAGLAVYLGWSLLQVGKLHRWLHHSHSTAPESVGLWGDIFDRLHKQQQRHKRTRDRLVEQLSRIQESTNSMRDGVVMTDAKGALEWWNGAAEHLLGFQHPGDRGQYIHNLIRTPSFKAYFDACDYREPLAMHSPARPHLHLLVQISLFGDGERLIMARDVTRLHQLEQMRRDFVANVSHELRTPLTVISGYLETLRDHGDDLPPPWQRALTTMTQQSARMEALVADLILLSKIETGEHTLTDRVMDVRALLEDLCRDGQALSGDQQHRFNLDIAGPCELRGDESQLTSAFSNLIFNAVNYTPAKGRITVRWYTDRDGAHLSVSDTGVGVDPVHIPRLTERFYRADPSRHQGSGGTGLGLAIVKHALLNHDGHLEINSQPGAGSTFTCHFPPHRLVARGAD